MRHTGTPTLRRVETNTPVTPTRTANDHDLLAAAHRGDRAAFGELCRRHQEPIRLYATHLTDSTLADDLVQEAFSATLTAIDRGSGPNDNFRAYVKLTVRRKAMLVWSMRHIVWMESIDVHQEHLATGEDRDRGIDRLFAASAFRTLPERWQTILWMTEVEGHSHTHIARVLDMNPNAVAQLAYRAREALRQAWINSHVKPAPSFTICAEVRSNLGLYSRGRASARTERYIIQHLAGCDNCTSASEEAHRIAGRLEAA